MSKYIKLFQAVLAAQAEEEAQSGVNHRHEEYDQLLAVYVDATLAGEEAGERYPEMAAHLADCVACQEEYELLLELLQEEALMSAAEDTAAPALAMAAPSLQEREPTPLPSLWETVEGGVRRLVVELRLELQQARLVLAAVPDRLQHVYQLQTAPAGLRTRSTKTQAEPPENIREALDFEDDEQNVRIRFFTGQVSEGRGGLRVEVSDLETAAAMAGVRVTLYNRERRLIGMTSTTSDGGANFRELLVGRYILKVQQGRGHEIFFQIGQP